MDDLKYHIFSHFEMNPLETRIRLAEVKFSEKNLTNKPDAKSPAEFLEGKDRKIYESGAFFDDRYADDSEPMKEESEMQENKSNQKENPNDPSNMDQKHNVEGPINIENKNEKYNYNIFGFPFGGIFGIVMYILKNGFYIIKRLLILHCIYYGMIYLASK